MDDISHCIELSNDDNMRICRETMKLGFLISALCIVIGIIFTMIMFCCKLGFRGVVGSHVIDAIGILAGSSAVAMMVAGLFFNKQYC